MKLKELQVSFQLALSDLYEKQEIDVFFFMLSEKQCGVSRLDLALNPDIECSDSELEVLSGALEQLIEATPIQHILGEKEFFGLLFKVGPEVLVPRPETEELVQWIIDDCKNIKQPIRILDVGTGSGCIAISLAKHLNNVEVTAIDVSKEALMLAKKNAKNIGVNVSFVEADVLNLKSQMDDFDLGKFDIIVSNPPYVRELEKEEIHPNVLNHDPHLALFVEDHNPLVFYKTILELGSALLVSNGLVYFEINQYLGEEMKTAFNNYNYRGIELRKDIFGNNRMMKGVI
ncbi:MAG: protein-(glutamine-N5) methyltransferase, release factor-specific [Bacteroidetes bacterium MedPE-SWsnd-G2]|nr:MAG: protein-(glutamine-N5) methyltransferase, release factor-specific [Bacteroidetes bacterium MedPE-SWsnd-G2]